MKVLLSLILALTFTATGQAAPHVWVVNSPTHEQTFTYGTERHQQWIARGPDRHLALAMEFTNDPYVDRIEPRYYDDFIFDFPAITLGTDGHTFYYRTPGGKLVAVAVRHPQFLGISEIRLTSGSELLVRKPHGFLSLTLIVSTRVRPEPNEEASLCGAKRPWASRA